jgi:Spy/CpxP family protein refolding chaperone
MRTLLKGTLVLCVAVGMVSEAQAQRRIPPDFDPGFLLLNNIVQKDLKITDEQKAKLKDAMEKIQDNHKDDYAKIREMSRKDQWKLIRTIREEARKAAAEILDAKQMTRFKQIQWQLEGARALEDLEAQKGLKLSGEQKKKLATIFEDLDKKLLESFQKGGTVSREQFLALQKETQDKANGVLSEEQKKNWKEMKGEPFEFPRPRR